MKQHPEGPLRTTNYSSGNFCCKDAIPKSCWEENIACKKMSTLKQFGFKGLARHYRKHILPQDYRDMGCDNLPPGTLGRRPTFLIKEGECPYLNIRVDTAFGEDEIQGRFSIISSLTAYSFAEGVVVPIEQRGKTILEILAALEFIPTHIVLKTFHGMYDVLEHQCYWIGPSEQRTIEDAKAKR